MNNNFMRPQQGNRNRNRNNRSRHRTGGNPSGGSGGGGNSANKVFDSNGPDVKLRGTAQTIAEKYMQLGRDSQSSGDSVAAENYYQHAEHYYRIWAANQPVGHSLQMSRKLGEDEFEDENGSDQGEEEGMEAQAPETTAIAESPEPQSEAQPQDSQDRSTRTSRDTRDNREGGRDRFRPRWPNRRERPPQEGTRDEATAPQVESAGAPAASVEAESGQWEAPSFLQRPTPTLPAESVSPVEPVAANEVAPKPVRTRRPREVAPAIVDDTPQGE